MRLRSAMLVPFAVALCMTASRAAEPVLVPDVSSRTIDIQYSFTGEDLLLFGAILYPGGRLPNDQADIAVVVRGPTRPILMREKQKIAGVWINAESGRFRSAPGFYAVAASRPIKDLVDERTASIYELGVGNLQLSPAGFESAAQMTRFERGLVDLYQRKSLFAENGGAVEISQGVLYRSRIRIPAQVPVGRYTAETFLISKGRVLAVASREITIRKTGLDRFVARSAQRNGFLYGLVAVGISVFLGWMAGALFRKA